MHTTRIQGLLTALAMGGVLWAQSPAVTAQGQLQVRWQGSGAVQSQVQPVAGGSATLQVGTVGLVDLTVGARTTIQIDAMSPPWNCYGCWSEAMGDVVLEFASPTPVAGVLVLDVQPVCIMGPSYVDVGLDGQWEAIGGVTPHASVPVVLSAEPLPVRLHAEAVNFGGATCRFVASVEFVPQPQSLGSLSPACGPVMTAALTGDPGAARTLSLRPAAAGVLGALLVGAPFWPQPMCLLLPGAEVLALYVPTPAGAIALPVAVSLQGALSLQYAELDAQGQILLGNAIGLLLP
jgi:hypothetical protein